MQTEIQVSKESMESGYQTLLGHFDALEPHLSSILTTDNAAVQSKMVEELHKSSRLKILFVSNLRCHTAHNMHDVSVPIQITWFQTFLFQVQLVTCSFQSQRRQVRD